MPPLTLHVSTHTPGGGEGGEGGEGGGGEGGGEGGGGGGEGGRTNDAIFSMVAETTLASVRVVGSPWLGFGVGFGAGFGAGFGVGGVGVGVGLPQVVHRLSGRLEHCEASR